jgi:hypothetical protein
MGRSRSKWPNCTRDLRKARPLYSLTLTKNADESVNSRDEQRAVSVLTGEPQRELYAVPATYLERSPSEVTAMLLNEFKNFDVGGCADCAATAEKVDWNYYASRGYAPEQ